MFHNILSFTMLLIVFLTSSTQGLIAPLIPPLSPNSPFYNQILEANNISTTTTTTNITLNESHYITYWLSQASNKSQNDKGEIFFQKEASHHVMNMLIGKPIQKVYGIFDTGSAITWFQGSKRAGETQYPIYYENRSSTYTTMNCRNEKRCNTQQRGIKDCDDSTTGLCEFKVTYGDGTNAYGVMGSDAIVFTRPGWKTLPDFMLGCSWDNSQSMMGIIGGGSSEYALPKQLYPEDPKFSYCISGDTTKTSPINFGPDATLKGQSLTMKSNPHTDFFYVKVLSIKVNGESIDVPSSIFEMSEYGTRGIIIDSGTMTTQLTTKAFDALKAKIAHFLGPPIKYLIFEICYATGKFGPVWPFLKRPTIALEYYPEFSFEFEEDRMWKPIYGSPNLECLLVIRTVILRSTIGAINLFDVNVGYDPGNDLLYLEKMTCPTM